MTGRNAERTFRPEYNFINEPRKKQRNAILSRAKTTQNSRRIITVLSAINLFAGHALHEKSLQRQIGVDTSVSSQELSFVSR